MEEKIRREKNKTIQKMENFPWKKSCVSEEGGSNLFQIKTK